MRSGDSSAISSLSDSASTLAEEPIETRDSPASSYTSSKIRHERHEPSKCTVVPSAPLHPKVSVRAEEHAQKEREAKKPGDKAPAGEKDGEKRAPIDGEKSATMAQDRGENGFQLRPNRTAFRDLRELARQDAKPKK